MHICYIVRLYIINDMMLSSSQHYSYLLFLTCTKFGHYANLVLSMYVHVYYVNNIYTY